MLEIPRLIEGGIGIDDRGEVLFANGFDFKGVKRFYVVSNHRVGFIRAWHAHKQEAKFVFVVAGTVLIGVVPIDNFEQPNKSAEIRKFVLSAKKPAVLFIPAGYANGAMTLTADARIMYFSTSTMEEAKGDDIRYAARYWDIWTVEGR